jgi:hypothetical protein
LTLSNSVFDSNKAQEGGTFYITGQSSLTINGGAIKGSYAYIHGGVLWAQDTTDTKTITIVIQSTTKIHNSQAFTGNGAVFYIDASLATLTITGTAIITKSKAY